MVKVLIITHNLRVANGVTSFLMNYYRNIDHNELKMDFAIYSEEKSSYFNEIKKNGGQIYLLPSIKNIKKHIEKCNEILQENKYDIIHDNTLLISIPIMFCAKKNNVPVRILHSHSTKMGETRYKEIRNIIFLPILRMLSSKYMACSIMAGKAMFKGEKFQVIPNVISSEKYCFDNKKRFQVRKEMNVEDKLVVGTVGRISKQKNPFFAINVFKKLSEVNPNIEYWWIGSGELANEIIDYIKEQHLTEKVKLLGSRNDVCDLYQAMDCFFLPSLFEGLPVVGVEAQAMGLPMVVSNAVTDEMLYTDLVDFVSLDEKIDVWVNHLECALKKNIIRKEYVNMLKQSPFTDACCGERLRSAYSELLKIYRR